MKTIQREALWRRLCEAGFAEGDVPPPSESASPWYVRTMLGVAGWIGALFLLGFVGAGMAFVFQTEEVGLVLGGICCAAAYAIFRAAPRNDVAAQFALAVSLAGQVMFGIGLGGVLGNNRDGTALFFAIALFEGVLAVVIPNFVHRVLTSFASAVAFGYFAGSILFAGVAAGVVAAALAVLWLREAEWAPRSSVWRPIGFGLTFALLYLELTPLLGLGLIAGRPITMEFLWIVWIGPLLMAGALIYTVSQLLIRHGESLGGRIGMAALIGSGVIAVATLRASGVASSLLILLLGFAGGNRTLFGVGVVGLLGYLSYYYYSLHATLLSKSVLLVATGLALIAMWAVTRALFGPAPVRNPGTQSETSHA